MPDGSNRKIKGVKIWTLNATSELLSGHESEIIRALQELKSREKIPEIAFGDREAHSIKKKSVGMDKKPEPTAAIHSNLMPEEEYFVPIAAKCLGGLLNTAEAGPIRKYYYKAWKVDSYKRFWHRQTGPYSDCRMITRDYKGYYEILEEESQGGDYEHILIGYSQGGMIALYLAWLDEVLFGGRAHIRAVLTLQSSNYGSPLANPRNANSIIDNALEMLLAFFSIYKGDSADSAGLIRHLRNAIAFRQPGRPGKNDKIYLCNFFMLLFQIYGQRKDGIRGCVNKKLYDFFYGLLQTIIKWAGGLLGETCNAFYDLDIARLLEKHTVMHSIHHHPPQKIPYGSVLSAFNELRVSTPVQPLTWLVRFLLGHTHELDRTVKENLIKAAQIFREKIMIESVKPSPSADFKVIKERIEIYKKGFPQNRLKPLAHDFVIPSSYQFITDSRKGNFILRNVPNDRASHLSGKSAKYEGGRKNLGLIKEFLRKL